MNFRNFKLVDIIKCNALLVLRTRDLFPLLIFAFSISIGIPFLGTEPWNNNEPSTLSAISQPYLRFFDPINISHLSEQGYAYVFLLKIWKNIFGNSRVSLRFVSALSYSLSGVFLYLICRPYGRGVAFLVSAFFVMNSANFMYSQHMRCYSLSCLLAIVSVFLLLRWERSLRIADLVYCVLIAILNIHCLFTTVFLLPYFIYRIVKRLRDQDSRKFYILIALFLLLSAPFLVLKSIAIFKHRFLIRRELVPFHFDYIESAHKLVDFFRSVVLFEFFLSSSVCKIAIGLSVLLYALGILRTLKEPKFGLKGSMLLLSAIVVPFLSIAILDGMGLMEIESRYFLFFSPLIAFSIAQGVLFFEAGIMRNLIAIMQLGMSAVVIFSYLGAPLYVDLNRTVSFIKENSSEKKVILCTDPDYLSFYIRSVWENDRGVDTNMYNCNSTELGAEKWNVKLGYLGQYNYQIFSKNLENESREIKTTKTFAAMHTFVTINREF